MRQKEELINNLANVMESFDYIDFALLFGSVNSGHDTKLSDVDIGIHASHEITLLEQGF